MEIRDAADTIRDTVTIEQLLDYYGYQHKHGKMLCPFHPDKNESMKIYGGTDGWYCFGCLKGGGVIDFVMEQDGCDFKSAVTGIDRVFSLGLLDVDDPVTNTAKREFRRVLDRLAANLNEQCNLTEQIIEIDLAKLTQDMTAITSKAKQAVTADEWTELLQIQSEMEYLEYKLAKVGEVRNEVRQWQRAKIRETAGRGWQPTPPQTRA